MWDCRLLTGDLVDDMQHAACGALHGEGDRRVTSEQLRSDKDAREDSRSANLLVDDQRFALCPIWRRVPLHMDSLRHVRLDGRLHIDVTGFESLTSGAAPIFSVIQQELQRPETRIAFTCGPVDHRNRWILRVHDVPLRNGGAACVLALAEDL